MKFRSIEMVERFQESFTPEFLTGIVQKIKMSHTGSSAYCAGRFPSPEAHDVQPHMRRAMVEEGIREVALNYADRGIRCEPILNKKRTAYHTLISMGSVYMTVSAVSHPAYVVRPAAFRQEYADPQDAFPFAQDSNSMTSSVGNDNLYAILLHGSDRRSRGKLSFVYVAFPAPNCKKYYFKFDLLARLANLEVLTAPIQEEAIAVAKPTPKLKLVASIDKKNEA